MADSKTDHRPDGTEYTKAEDADSGLPRMAETAPAFVLRPSSGAEADMLREIDAIQERLRVGIPQLHREMDILLGRIHTPGSL
nr:hypothetical protein [uncultured Rhodopila sp.]